MKKHYLGISLGTAVGFLYGIFMTIKTMPLETIVFMFIFWVIAGFFISTTVLKVKGVVSGAIISLLFILPSLIIIGWKDQDELIPIFLLTIFFGGLLGFLIKEYGK